MLDLWTAITHFYFDPSYHIIQMAPQIASMTTAVLLLGYSTAGIQSQTGIAECQLQPVAQTD